MHPGTEGLVPQKSQSHKHSFRPSQLITGIRPKLIGVLLIAGIALITILSILANQALTKDYLSLENAQVLRNIQRAKNALAIKTKSVSNNAKDWSNWDDAYQYAHDKNAGFEASAMPETLFSATKIDLVAFFKPDRSFLNGYERANHSDERINIDTDILENLMRAENSFLTDMPTDGLFEGIMQTKRGPLVLISRPIVTSKGEGPARGWLLFGNFVNEDFVQDMANITQLQLSFTLPHPNAAKTRDSNEIIIQDNLIEAHIPFHDVQSKPAFEIVINSSRDIVLQGQRTILLISLFMSIVALIFVFIIFIAIDRTLLRRIRSLADVSEKITTELDLSMRVVFDGNDELSTLGRGFNRMVETMDHYTENLRRILDNVSFGFFLVDPSLTIREGHSHSCLALLQRKKLAHVSLGDALQLSATEAKKLDENLQIVFSGEIPDELSLAMLPMKFRVGASTLRCTAKTVRNKNNTIEHLLFSVVDITDLEVIEQENRENQSIIRALHYPQAFSDFLTETSFAFRKIRDSLAHSDQQGAKQTLHALKSSFGFFSFVAITEYIHQIEGEPTITLEMIKHIESSLERFVEKNKSILSLNKNGEKSICSAQEKINDLENILDKPEVSMREIKTKVKEFCTEIRLTPVSNLIQTLPAVVEEVALQECKNVKFTVEGEGIRVPKDTVGHILFTLPLLIKNAIIHGIEHPHERGPKGEMANLVLSFKRKENSSLLIIELRDDGRGLNHERILKRALEIGLVSPEKAQTLSNEDIAELVFANGFSTAETTTNNAGRGIGLGSVKETIESLGGKVLLKKNTDGGLTVEMSLALHEWSLT